MAQARILDDKLADPIMAGDKVFTPLWSPGQQNHFALTGIMNLDGDGRNQLNVVRRLIDQNGGEVDCWLDERGHKQGQVTSNTRFIVKGDAPDKGSTETIKNHGDILRDAEHYQVHTITLPDFKQQMGYQKSSSVEHFGTSAPSVDAGKAPGAPRPPPSRPKRPLPRAMTAGHSLIMPPTATAAQILDREFLTIRGKLLEVAAALDRIERGQGSAATDQRLEKIRETLTILGREGADRAEQLQLVFSLPYEPGWRKG